MTVRFSYIQPTAEQKEAMQILRDRFQTLYDELNLSLEDNRGKSIALTKLEECSFWINKSITDNC